MLILPRTTRESVEEHLAGLILSRSTGTFVTAFLVWSRDEYKVSLLRPKESLSAPLPLRQNMYSSQSLPQTSIHLQEYPHVPLCRDVSSNLGPERPLLEEDDKQHTSLPSLPSPSSQSKTPNNASSPAAMFLSAFSTTSQPQNPDNEGHIISGYTLGDIIGYGSTSIIRKASSTSGDVVAVKIIYHADLLRSGNAPHARKRLQHEASVWSSLSHEHILPLFSAVYTSRADYFVTLYCPAGSLFDILKRDGTPALLQDDAGTMFRQVVRGLRYLHEISLLVHRDMKLENVLVDEMGMCRIADFGMSRNIDSDVSDDEDYLDQLNMCPPSVQRAFSLSAKRQLGKFHNNHLPRHRHSTSTNQPIHRFQPGSLPYAAPELLLPQTSETLYPHPRQDIWALGVMLYALLTGRLPFADSFEPRLQIKILKGECFPFLVDSVHPLTSFLRRLRGSPGYWPWSRTNFTRLLRKKYIRSLEYRHGGRCSLGCRLGCGR